MNGEGHEPSWKLFSSSPGLSQLGSDPLHSTRDQGGSGNPEASKSLLFAQKSVTQNSNIVKPDR